MQLDKRNLTQDVPIYLTQLQAFFFTSLNGYFLFRLSNIVHMNSNDNHLILHTFLINILESESCRHDYMRKREWERIVIQTNTFTINA